MPHAKEYHMRWCKVSCILGFPSRSFLSLLPLIVPMETVRVAHSVSNVSQSSCEMEKSTGHGMLGIGARYLRTQTSRSVPCMWACAMAHQMNSYPAREKSHALCF